MDSGKSLDERRQIFRQSLVANPDLGQSLDQIESRAGRVQCREHHCGGSLVGAQQNHQHVDEKAFVVRPAADQVSDQGENECAAIRRGGSRGSEHVKVRFWRQLADKHGKVSADAGGPLIVTASSPRKYISKDIVAKVGRVLFCNYYRKNVAFLLLSCCSSLASDDFLSQSRFLAFRLNKSKLLCTIKMLSDLFHSDPEGSEAIYR